MDSAIKQICKLSHKQFRALLKKFRRKRKRQQIAKLRDQEELLEQQKKENSPSFKQLEEEIRRNSQLYDEFEERERLRQHKVWLWREQQAQILFKKKQEQLELDKLRKEEERKRILEEFEKQQTVENEKSETNLKVKSQKEEAYQEVLSKLPEGDGPWCNPEINTDQQQQNQCQFFAKTGCCRFGDRCSRGHFYPSSSTTILIKGMFTHYSIDHTGREDHDTDMALEYDDKETYQDFKTFYYDVLPEFKKYGKVVQFKVCNNHEAHLRGNVYVQYSDVNEASLALQHFNGRYYAGKQLTCEFSNVVKWKAAICGLYFQKRCPKGINCNFLHVFKNPNEEFWEADRDLPDRNDNYSSRFSRSRHGNSERSSHHSHSSNHRHQRNDSPDRFHNYHSSSHHSRKYSDSDSEVDERSRHNSSHRRQKDRNGHSHSSHKRKHRESRSRSRSRSNTPESFRSHKKNKHKKKKKKKSKNRSSDESEN